MTTTGIAVASVDITPRKAATLGGYSNRHMPYEGVEDSLEANILWLCSGDARLVIVTLDLLYPGQLLRDKLLEGLDLREEELFLAASHTHFAPMTTPGLPGLGLADNAYVALVAERIVAMARALEKESVPAHCIRHTGTADHAINRRLARWRLLRSGLRYGCEMGPNPGGAKDERIELLEFRDEADRILAILWNYACHPTGFPEVLKVSAEFPGVVRARLREALGAIPVLYLQGFSGDIRPPFRGMTPTVMGLARRILQGPQFRKPSMPEWRAWAGDLANCVTGIAQDEGNSIALEVQTLERLVVPEAELGEGGNGDKPLVWHHADCGGFRLIGVNAEPVTAYRALIAAAFPDKPLLTAGCADQTHGYLPTDAMLAQGGYEVEGFRPLFSYATRYRSGLQAAAIQPLIVKG